MNGLEELIEIRARNPECASLALSPDARPDRAQLARVDPHPDRRPGYLNGLGDLLDGQWLAAMDSAQPHAFAFNEAISLMVGCESQDEIDQYWEKLSASGTVTVPTNGTDVTSMSIPGPMTWKLWFAARSSTVSQ